MQTIESIGPSQSVSKDIAGLIPQSLVRELPLFEETISFDLIGRRVAEQFREKVSFPRCCHKGRDHIAFFLIWGKTGKMVN